MSKKVWKLTEEAARFIYSVCPDEVTAAQLTKKAYVCFNSEQTCVDFTLATLNPGKTLECKATIRLWREECCVLDEDDEIARPWELTAEELAQLDDDEDDVDDEDDSSDEHDGILNCVVIVKHDEDSDDNAAEAKKDNE